jgi:DNA polymerase I-like protein with 3'-5' exonuclease and polymerase domains
LNLFDIVEDPTLGPRPPEGWKPDEPPDPDLLGPNLVMDFESTGKRWWKGDMPIGLGVMDLATRQRWYVNWGHRQGENLNEEACRGWLRRFRNKHIYNSKTHFDLHLANNWGVDLEDGDNKFGDVQHYAALLDDHRYSFGQGVLMRDFLGDAAGKLTEVEGERLDPSRFKDYHPWVVGERAKHDIQGVGLLLDVMIPRLQAENLMAVKELEDEVIPAVVEMERRGCPIDEEKLDRWIREVKAEKESLMMTIMRDVRVQFRPDSPKAWSLLMRARGIKPTVLRADGLPSIKLENLQPFAADPYIEMALRLEKLADLESKYLHKYRATIEGGVIRYALHQLRSDDGGTVSGRFSSAALSDDKGEKDGINAQQVMDPDKQLAGYGPGYIIKELFIEDEEDCEMAAADAEQIEYRVFADEANSPRINAAYDKDPWLKFHHLIHEMLKPYRPDLLYKQAKNINFMKVYGGGMVKLAMMMGFLTEAEGAALNAEFAGVKYGVPKNHPKLVRAVEVNAIYERELPEVPALLRAAQQQALGQGFVTTKLGRRTRFPQGRRAHKALNAKIQGTAADINKKKICELRKRRKAEKKKLKLRITNHDEFVVGLPKDNGQTFGWMMGVLNEQTTPTRIPILWAGKTGPNWAVCKGK